MALSSTVFEIFDFENTALEPGHRTFKVIEAVTIP